MFAVPVLLDLKNRHSALDRNNESFRVESSFEIREKLEEKNFGRALICRFPVFGKRLAHSKELVVLIVVDADRNIVDAESLKVVAKERSSTVNVSRLLSIDLRIREGKEGPEVRFAGGNG